jgi:hypothetical protein
MTHPIDRHPLRPRAYSLIPSMGLFEAAADFVQKTEKLIIVTITLAVGGIILAGAEHYGFMSFAGLEPWVRPTLQIVWVFAVAHVSIHTLIGGGRLTKLAFQVARDTPRRIRQATYDSLVHDRLMMINGLAREVLCYALFRDDDHIWYSEDETPKWVDRLRSAGLVDVSEAGYGTVHLRIQKTAWAYMKKHPTKFVSMLAWPGYPWTIKASKENEIEAAISEARKKRL